MTHKVHDIDFLTEFLSNLFKWSYDNNRECIIDINGNVVEWTDYETETFDPISILGEDSPLVQVSMWGDGTIEFGYEDGESINWCEFPQSIVEEVENKLILKSIRYLDR